MKDKKPTKIEDVKVLMKMPANIKEKAKTDAKALGLSLSAYIRMLIMQAR